MHRQMTVLVPYVMILIQHLNSAQFLQLLSFYTCHGYFCHFERKKKYKPQQIIVAAHLML